MFPAMASSLWPVFAQELLKFYGPLLDQIEIGAVGRKA